MPPITRTPITIGRGAGLRPHSVQSYLVTVASHATVARHTHSGVWEMGYVVSGMLTVSVAGQAEPVDEAGRLLGIPKRRAA